MDGKFCAWLSLALLLAAEDAAQAKVAGLDSSYNVPSDAALAEAKAAGVRLWMGYLPLPGSAHGWAQSDFQRVKAAGLATLAFAFGAADARQARDLAAAWGVRLCLDVEAPWGDGPWVDPWLAESGAGIYGNRPVLINHRGHMPFAIMAAYPGYDPGTNDPGLNLGVPTGWQWEGTHTEFGGSVDRGWYDDWFALPENRPPQGSLDQADCQQVTGWAQDPDVPMQAIQAHVYLNGQTGQPGAIGIPLLANQHRPDLCGAYGCDHGFSMPWPRQLLYNQPHEVNAYGIDAQGGANTRLAGSPKTVQCALPPLSGVRRWVPSGTVLQNWKFDGFWDTTRYPQGQIDQVAAGPEWPDAPVAVQAMGHQEIWVIDGEVKRRVPSPTALLAWRLQVAMVAEVDHYRQGPDLRPQPQLVQGDAVVYMLDDDPGQPLNGPQGGEAVPAGDRIDITGGCQATRGGAGQAGWGGMVLLLLAASLSRRMRLLRPPIGSRSDRAGRA